MTNFIRREYDAQLLDALDEIMDGIHLLSLDAEAYLDREIPIRHMVTTTLRGILGYALDATAPDMVERFFKPGTGAHGSPAFVLQPRYRETVCAQVVPFRLQTWDRDGAFMDAMLRAMANAKGCPFGDGAAHLEGIRMDEPAELRPDLRAKVEVKGLRLRTPLRIKSCGRLLSRGELTLGHLVSAACRRLNTLSAEYGNGRDLDEMAALALCATTRIRTCKLDRVESGRRSGTQKRDIDLSGIVGSITWNWLPDACAQLLILAQAVNLGQHTSAGCGCVEVL